MTKMAPGLNGTTNVPKKKEKQDEAIIGTNDYSIVSKRSVEKLYHHDEPEFLRPFIGKFKRRAPLINRGYWLRMRAIEHVVKIFLDEPSTKSKNIINLGCGYEPLPFRMLWKYKSQCRNVKFIDIDFPRLMHRKVQVIHKNTMFTDLLDGSSGEYVRSESILLDDARYCAIGCDLGDAARMRELFSMLHLRDHAVLFLAEVSMVYMESDQATTLIKLCSELPDARFCMLEQHLPAGLEHPFARTMIDHFNKQTPLRALNSYPTIDSQRTRFESCEWPEVVTRNLWSLWQDDEFLDHRARFALETCEPFDEWEEFALFAGHYFLLAATTRGASSFAPLRLSSELPESNQASLKFEHPPADIRMLASRNAKTQGQRRFGAIFDVNENSFAHHGGLCSTTQPIDTDLYARNGEYIDLANFPENLMCHTITTLHDGSVLFAGGRRSPANPSAACYLQENGKWTKTHGLYPARYRHCSVAVTVESRANVLTVGGKDRKGYGLPEWQLYDRELGWRVLKSNSCTSIFGAAMVATTETSGVLLGGMTDTGIVLSHYIEWEVNLGDDGELKVKCQKKWDSRSDRKGAYLGISRFGACLLKSQRGLIMIGGIGPNGVLKADEEIMFIEPDGAVQNSNAISGILASGIPRPMLIGHSARVVDDDNIIIVGGGGVCFSFGAFWNDNHFILSATTSRTKTSEWRLVSLDSKRSGIEHRSSQLFLDGSKDGVSLRPAEHHTEARIQALQHAQEIPHSEVSSPEDFQHLVSAAKPVIIQKLDLGPCKTLWTPEYLKEKVGSDRSVIVHSSNEPHLSFLEKNFTYESQTFGAFIDAAMSGSYVYLRALSSENPSKLPAALHRDFPTISDDFMLPDALKMTWKNEHSSVLRISGHTTMWLHYDVMANILCQIRGSKRVVLFPPADISLLKFAHGETTSGLNIFTAAEGVLKDTHPVETVLKEGEIVFIPACWAHATAPAGEGGSVAINIFFKSFENKAYAAGKDVYGNRDLGVYQNGRRDVDRIIKSFANDCEATKKERAECVVLTLRGEVRKGRGYGDGNGNGKGEKEVVRILKSVEGLPGDIRKFYLDRLAEELEDFAKSCPNEPI